MQMTKLSMIALTVLATTAGCELIASVDRGKIAEGTAGTGGATTASATSGSTGSTSGTGGGTGGATASSGTGGTTTSGTGGTGGTTTSTTSSGVGGATTSSSGTGGAGGGCVTPADCPAPPNACVTATCVATHCGTSDVAAGTVLVAQQTGDCKVDKCDGAGNVVGVIDDTDKPVDANACTDDVCAGGMPSNPFTTMGATCGTSLLCDGAGHCVGCNQPSDCPPGPDTECRARTCVGGTCGLTLTPVGTALSVQTSGDCQQLQCDGVGAIVSVVANNDKPVDDGNPCTTDTCNAGAPVHPAAAAGTACSQGGIKCNGAGACVACLLPIDCGVDTLCQTRTCVAGACGVNNVAAGTAAGPQVTGDCHTQACDGAGNLVNGVDNADKPADDGNQCTLESCSAGAPGHPFAAAGAACAQNGGVKCDGNGACIACSQASDCGADTACQTHTCTGGVCGVNNVGAGTPAGTQVPGDCHTQACDGAGNLVNGVDDADKPADDGNPCTGEACTNGVASHPFAAQGAACAQNGGVKCDGNGACVACLAPVDCGVSTTCKTFTCASGACGSNTAAAGTLVANTTVGDCRSDQCDASGNVVTNAVDDNDKPADDGNQCTLETCSSGVPGHPAAPASTSCNQNGGNHCDGGGACVACTFDGECPTPGDPCLVARCNVGVCGAGPSIAHVLPAGLQTAGDCQQKQCDGSGNTISVADDTDTPDDGNDCTTDACAAGVPSSANKAMYAPCAQSGGSICDGSGDCVSCIDATDCGGTSTTCHTITCLSGACGSHDAAPGTVVLSAAGDCHQSQCDGAGNTSSVIDDTDVPADDGSDCTSEICTLGVASHPAKAQGTACTSNGGVLCDGASACTQTFTLVHVGTGAAALASTTTATSLDTYYPVAGSAAISTTALPTMAALPNNQLTLSGTATTEGGLSRSADGHYVTLAGYAANTGLATTGTTRVAGRMSAAGAVDTSTTLTGAFTANSVRGATSADGSAFWVSGNGSGTTGGVWYATLGATAGTQVLGTPANARVVNIFAGQLYGSAGSSPFTDVFTIGAGLPTTGPQTAVAFPGMPTTGATPLGFVLFDLNAAVAGVDTLFVADSALQRWTFNGTTWTKDAAFTAISSSCFGVAGWTTSTGVTLVVTTASLGVVKVDVTTAGAFTTTTLFSAATNTAFRGVALAPH
jgi:hypothetical protein